MPLRREAGVARGTPTFLGDALRGIAVSEQNSLSGGEYHLIDDIGYEHFCSCKLSL